MNLIIVESLDKVAKIKNFLGTDYEVVALVDDIKEFTKVGFNQSGINDDGSLNKQLVTNNKQVVNFINNYLKTTDFTKIYIATNLDWEGEVIANDIYSILDSKNQAKALRIGFKTITKDDIQKALNNSIGQIDQNLVAAQNVYQGINRIIDVIFSRFAKKENKNLFLI